MTPSCKKVYSKSYKVFVKLYAQLSTANMMRNLYLFLMTSVLLVSCGSPDGSPVKTAQLCQQAENFVDKAEQGPALTHRDWDNLMLAGARLIYVTNECGDRVKEPKSQLCADVRETMQVFVNNPKIPAGVNRTTAINQSRLAYEKAACELPLIVPQDPQS
jgi:hypothetical protein